MVVQGGSWTIIDTRASRVAWRRANFLAGVAVVVAKDETMTTKNGVLPYTIEVVDDDAARIRIAAVGLARIAATAA